MRRECQERLARNQLQRKPLVSDPGMHHGTCVTHVPWDMSGSLTRSGGENVLGIPGACATRNFMYLARGPWISIYVYIAHGLKLLIHTPTSTTIQLEHLWSQGTGSHHGCCFTSHRKLEWTRFTDAFASSGLSRNLTAGELWQLCKVLYAFVT